MKRRNFFKSVAATAAGATLPAAKQARKVFHIRLPDNVKNPQEVLRRIVEGFRA